MLKFGYKFLLQVKWKVYFDALLYVAHLMIKISILVLIVLLMALTISAPMSKRNMCTDITS
jgi:hypothetical protein